MFKVTCLLFFCAGFVSCKYLPNNGKFRATGFFPRMIFRFSFTEEKRGAVAEEKCQGFPAASGGTNHIIGGDEVATLDDFPYVAALGSDANGNGNLSFHCGASLISYDFLLTAAHCILQTGSKTIARFGAVKLYDYNPNDPPVDIGIERAIVHPQMDIHDIALLKLERSIRAIEDFIRPICLYTDLEDPNPGLILTVAGWGYTDPNTDPGVHRPILLKGQINVWPQENCTEVVQKGSARKIRLEGKMCALSTNSTGYTSVDTCKGDSGGPLELEKDGRRYLVGIISTGYLCGTNGMPGFYTRVSSYINWIEANVWPEVGKDVELDPSEAKLAMDGF